MTAKADFTEQEWDAVLEGPPSAGMIVVTASRGGTFRETFAIGKAYAEARKQHGASQLLDEIVSAKPEIDHTRYHSPEELKEHALQHLRDAVEVLGRKATPEEVDDYRRFVLGLAERVAEAHKEDGTSVSGPEQAAIDDIKASLGSSGDVSSAAEPSPRSRGVPRSRRKTSTRPAASAAPPMPLPARSRRASVRVRSQS
jgi:hypothetical protein